MTRTTPARRDGIFYWRVAEEARGEFRAVDGVMMQAAAFSAYEVVGLATATGAPNVRKLEIA